MHMYIYVVHIPLFFILVKCISFVCMFCDCKRKETYCAAIVRMCQLEGLLFTSYVVPTNTLQEWPHEWGTVVSGKQPTALEEAAKKWRLELMEKRKVCPVLWM